LLNEAIEKSIKMERKNKKDTLKLMKSLIFEKHSPRPITALQTPRS
jgi:hypothetical protein